MQLFDSLESMRWSIDRCGMKGEHDGFAEQYSVTLGALVSVPDYDARRWRSSFQTTGTTFSTAIHIYYFTPGLLLISFVVPRRKIIPF
jgi:hypothetical protein